MVNSGDLEVGDVASFAAWDSGRRTALAPAQKAGSGWAGHALVVAAETEAAAPLRQLTLGLPRRVTVEEGEGLLPGLIVNLIVVSVNLQVAVDREPEKARRAIIFGATQCDRPVRVVADHFAQTDFVRKAVVNGLGG